ncbi:hypothetical protein SAMN04488003_11353 [Loktanella fryxellensis]|uniref:Uncharacterized protein n=1 Tax=Loktanella fryxellensis TaxID=245187 RepID=A0A1H8FLL8_9RHOB|nr:hypothetical protein [Loktanella fryxellensis]SEN32404.1 hypothetical protein SAMN04488003_11353 [Loktanella fryxellensis]
MVRLTTYVTCAGLGTVLAAPVAAGPFDGTYRQAANAECALVGIDGGSVRIAEGIFYGVEVECRMTNPVNVVDMDAQLYTMACSGEGQTFNERAMLLNSAQSDGIIMVWDGYAFVYDRCPDPDAVPLVIDTPPAD